MHKHFITAYSMLISKNYLGSFRFLAAELYISDLNCSLLKLVQFIFSIFSIVTVFFRLMDTFT